MSKVAPGPEFARELRRLRQAAGLSQAELAKRIHYTKAQISKIENGHATPSGAFAEACDTALGADGKLAALARGSILGLPSPTRHFTGRQDELAQLHDLLTGPAREYVWCLLTGMAGVGKTALAVQAAWNAKDSFRDGCLFFDLHGYSPSSAEVSSYDALDRLLRTLGVRGPDIPSDQDGRANLYRSRLIGRQFLLVFDNVRSTAQIAPLIPAEPECRVLITSRNRLNALDDTVNVPVGELSTAEAIQLFRSVAKGREGVPAEDEPVAAVVECCGRLPLAVRIAAARFRGGPWTFDEFARRLADEAARLDTLDDGERSVAAAFNLSYEGLPEPQRRLFGLLALHPGRDVPTHSAAALAGLGIAEAERLLDRLADAHLIIQRHGGYYQFHDLVRMFATKYVLAGVPLAEQDAAATRLLDLALFRTEACDRLLAAQRYRPAPLPGVELLDAAEGFDDEDRALAWLDVEWPNLVAMCEMAAAREDHQRCWRLAFLLRSFFFRTKLWDAWIETHERAAVSARLEGDTSALALTLNNLGMAYADRGDLNVGRGHYEQALTLFREAGDEHGTTGTLSNLAWVNLYLGKYEIALRDMRVALESYLRTGSTRNAAITMRGIALAEVELGALDDALRHAEQAREQFQGSELDVAMSLNCIAWVHFRAGRYEEACAYYESACAEGERSWSLFEAARATTGLGNIAAFTGRHKEATEIWAQATQLHAGLNPAMVGETRVRYEWEDSQAC